MSLQVGSAPGTFARAQEELALVSNHVWPVVLILEELVGLENPEVMRGGRNVCPVDVFIPDLLGHMVLLGGN